MLGFASPRHLLRSLTSRELAEWMAFYRVRAERQEEQRRTAEREAKARSMAEGAAQGRL